MCYRECTSRRAREKCSLDQAALHTVEAKLVLRSDRSCLRRLTGDLSTHGAHVWQPAWEQHDNCCFYCLNRPWFVPYHPLFSLNRPLGLLIHQLLRSFHSMGRLINQAAIEMGSRDADRLESGSECYQFSTSIHFGEPPQERCKLELWSSNILFYFILYLY